MGQKIYAQRDLPVDGLPDQKKGFKRGEVVIELPEGVSLQTLITMATLGELGEDAPKADAKPEEKRSVAASAPVAASAK